MVRKHYFIIAIALIILSLGVYKLMTVGPGSKIEIFDSTPVIDWRLLYKYDYEAGEGPKELMELDGKIVKIPGYVVPLSDNYSQLDEFILVPDGQSCIHVPPPPPNLIIAVKLRKPLSPHQVANPAWITGVLIIEHSENQYGGAAFKMDALKFEKYEFEGY